MKMPRQLIPQVGTIILLFYDLFYQIKSSLRLGLQRLVQYPFTDGHNRFQRAARLNRGKRIRIDMSWLRETGWRT